eukprot:5491542-Pleurochrysis_carterae.AAC.1
MCLNCGEASLVNDELDKAITLAARGWHRDHRQSFRSTERLQTYVAASFAWTRRYFSAAHPLPSQETFSLLSTSARIQAEPCVQAHMRAGTIIPCRCMTRSSQKHALCESRLLGHRGRLIIACLISHIVIEYLPLRRLRRAMTHTRTQSVLSSVVRENCTAAEGRTESEGRRWAKLTS